MEKNILKLKGKISLAPTAVSAKLILDTKNDFEYKKFEKKYKEWSKKMMEEAEAERE